MKLFGKKKKKAAPSLDSSIRVLDEQLTRLEKAEQHKQHLIDQCVATARAKLKANDKRSAKFQLQKKKLLDRDLNRLHGMKMNILAQKSALQNASMNKDAAQVFKQANEALQHHVNDDQVDEAREIMDDMADNMAIADELGDALAQPLGDMDEDELDEELEELQNEVFDQSMLGAPVVPAGVQQNLNANQVAVPAVSAPAAPAAPETEEQRQARELAELEAMMN